MSKRTQGRYDDYLKRQVAQQVVDMNHRQCDVARQYGISDKLVSRWAIEYRTGTHWARSQDKVDEDAEFSRLQRENKRLQQENEILKKASAYFAKQLR